jgi:hypothetical protein
MKKLRLKQNLDNDTITQATYNKRVEEINEMLGGKYQEI